MSDLESHLKSDLESEMSGGCSIGYILWQVTKSIPISDHPTTYLLITIKRRDQV